MQKKRGPGPKGNVYKRPNGKYQAQIIIDGVPHCQTYPNKAGAEAYLRRMRKSSQRPDRIDQQIEAEKLTLVQAVYKRIDALGGTKGDEAEICKRLRRLAESVGAMGNMRMNAITVADVAAFRDERVALGNASNTVCSYISSIATTYAWLEEKHSLGLENPALKVSRPKQTNKRPKNESERETRVRKRLHKKRLTPEMEKVLLEAAISVQANRRSKLAFAALIRFAIDTTMRLAEVADVNWDDIIWGKNQIHIPFTKNGEERSPCVWPSTMDLLAGLDPQEEGPIWASKGTISKTWRLVREQAAVELEARGRTFLAKRMRAFRFHDLRHEGICRLFELTNLTERQIAEITGHKTSAMLWHYAKSLRTDVIAKELARSQGVEDWEPERRTKATEVKVDVTPPDSPAWDFISRDAVLLKAAVWSRPVVEFARQMEVSDVAVHKACKRLGVDKPPRGYWLEPERRVAT